MKFPPPLPLNEHVTQARKERRDRLVKVAWIGILLRSFIVMIEFAGVVYFESASLFVDAVATLVDISSTLVLIMSLKFASRPPDPNHPFGHGRFEPIMGLQLSLLLMIIGIGMGVQQIFLTHPSTHVRPISPLAWIIPAFATVVLVVATRMVSRAAREKESAAMKADAAHFIIDAATSLIATFALLLGSFIPDLSNFFDHLGAFIISVALIVLGLKSAKENFAQLMDQVPEGKYFEIVRKAAHQVEGVLGTEKIRIQLYGPDAHVDIDVEVEPSQSVEEAHKISQRVRNEIQHQIPQVRDVTVHLEPYYAGDHE